MKGRERAISYSDELCEFFKALEEESKVKSIVSSHFPAMTQTFSPLYWLLLGLRGSVHHSLSRCMCFSPLTRVRVGTYRSGMAIVFQAFSPLLSDCVATEVSSPAHISNHNSLMAVFLHQ